MGTAERAELLQRRDRTKRTKEANVENKPSEEKIAQLNSQSRSAQETAPAVNRGAGEVDAAGII